VTGLYWLPALDPEPTVADLDLAGWREATRRRVKLLFAVLRHLGDDIGDAGTFAVGGTRLGGSHGYGPGGATAPMGGAVSGFLKAYARERVDALVKVVDVAVGEPDEAVAARLLAETERDPGCVEVGHHVLAGAAAGPGGEAGGMGEGRLAISVQPQVDPPAGAGMTLDGDTVFVVTGAAGSIVSAITADLARHCGGTFYLLDLTPEPDPADDDLRRFATDRDGLKRDVFERMKAAGERATPAMVDRELARLERLEAAQAAIEAIADAGGRAHYRSVDLTDADAVAAAVDEVRATHGRVDVLLHAAGVEVSHFLPDKEQREFDLVFDVKCDGWFNLLHALGDLPLGATVVFSSVAGRFGNGGQVDYSAANDLLCKYTAMLGATRPDTLAIALDWTAWAGIGMAARGSIPKMMAMAGIEMLDPEAGIAMVRRQLEAGAAGEAVVGGALGLLVAERHPSGGLDPSAIDVSGTGPMVGEVTGMGVYSGLEVVTTFDPAEQPFLHDHRIDDTPVLPGVMGIEAFAEVATLAVPGTVVAAVEDVSFLAPFKCYRDEPRAVTVRAHPSPAPGDGGEVVVRCELVGHRRLPGQDEDTETVHFTGTVRLVPPEHGPVAERVEPPPDETGRVVTADELYRVYFHGDAYRVLDRVWRVGGAVVGRLADDLPPNHHPPELPLGIAPRLVEACFQTAGSWDIGRAGALGLPTAVGRVNVPADADHPGDDGGAGPRFAVVRPVDDGTFDAVVVDAAGRVLVRLEGYRTTTLPGGPADDEVAPFREAMS
jgi:NAD(P)-dependent dehydrogenase (short-subunit alcohol dehydrogenase family)